LPIYQPHLTTDSV
jgi:hypothetical protein